MKLPRQLLKRLAGTPLHPQWLLGRRRAPVLLRQAAGTVLDIGSADRWIQRELPAGARYVALDYPPTGTALYQATPDILGDAARLPLRDGSIDFVICLEVIEHVRDPDAVLAEIARVLKPGGRGCLSMPFMYPVHDAPHDFQRWTRHGWVRSAGAAGLRIESLQPRGTAIETAGLLACLALAGPFNGQTGWKAVLAAPLVFPAVLVINLAAWAAARAWPGWDAMSSGLEIEIRKP